MKIIYADNNATTAVAPEVSQAMAPFFTEKYFNPSSMYEPALAHGGRALAEARAHGRPHSSAWPIPKQILFTSCATESNSTAIFGAVKANPNRRHIITTAVEHPAVLEVCKDLQRNGYEVTFLGVDGQGQLDVGQFIRALRPDTLLVSIMHANNETGVIFPIEQLSRLAKETDPAIVFHTDATQSVGKLPIDLARRLPLRRSALVLRPQAARPQGRRRAVHQARHALPAAVDRRAPGGRPPGGHRKRPLHRRPGQGRGTGRRASGGRADAGARPPRPPGSRPGATASPTSRSTAKAPRGCPTRSTSPAITSKARGCSTSSSDCRASAPPAARPAPPGRWSRSHVLRAMNVPFTAVHGSIRFSFSRYNTDEDVDRIIEVFPGIVANLRRMSPYWDQEKNAPRADADDLIQPAR